MKRTFGGDRHRFAPSELRDRGCGRGHYFAARRPEHPRSRVPSDDAAEAAEGIAAAEHAPRGCVRVGLRRHILERVPWVEPSVGVDPGAMDLRPEQRHRLGAAPTVRKAASGAAERLPFIQVTNLARTLADLKSRHIWIVGAAGGGMVSLYESDFAAEPVALVMGSEGEGLRRLTQESCDQLIYIPMRAPVESLNVSVAAAVCLFEFRRVRDQVANQA